MRRPLTNEDEKCGVGCIKFGICQKLADIRIFVALMCLVIAVQGTYLGYVVGVLTTIEKRFEIKTSEAGVLLAMYDIGHTCTVLFVGYCLADRHKPRWTAFGVILSALAMFCWSLPNFIFGPTKLPGAHQSFVDDSKCNPDRNQTAYLSIIETSCTNPAHFEAYLILCISQVLAGIAAAPFNTISYIYIDDNVSNRQSPFFLGILTSMYAFGPALGFGLSFLCNRVHADLKEPAGIDFTSPSWVGAWWLGFIICGILYLLAAIPLFCFPYRMPDKRKLVEKMESNIMMSNGRTKVGDDNESLPYETSCCKRIKDTTKELPFATWQIIKNPVYTSMVVAWIFGSYLVGGYGTYLPLYIETQYLQSASISDIYAGLISIGSVALSTAVGGYLLSRFDIKPRRATLYLMATWSVIVVTYLLGMVTGCNDTSLQSSISDNGFYNYTTSCNSVCKCDVTMNFDPVSSGNTTYFNPCYAGCTEFTNNEWTNCMCAQDPETPVEKKFLNNCNNLPIYVTIMFVGLFIGNLFFMVTMMVVLRCVQDDERSLALSFASCLTNIFGFIPSPIIFGFIIDTTCMHSQCSNKRGNCILYNNKGFRFKYHLANAGFQTVAIVALFVTYIMTRTFTFPEDREDSEYEVDAENTENEATT